MGVVTVTEDVWSVLPLSPYNKYNISIMMKKVCLFCEYRIVYYAHTSLFVALCLMEWKALE